jgi:hypothetical protein
MNASLGLAILVAGPLFGSLAVLLIPRSRAWQVIAGAVVGQILAYVFLRLWSSSLSHPAGGQRGMVASLPQQSWSEQAIHIAMLLMFAAAIGGLAVYARRLALRARP